jgi:hypothetical protein
LFIEMPFEGVQSASPEPSVGLKPLIYLDEWFGTQAVEAPLRVVTYLDQAGLAEHPKVLGDARLTEREVFDQFPDWSLAFAQQVEDTPPGGFGQNLEGRYHTLI